MANLEKQMAFVFGEIDLGVGARSTGEFFYFVHGFFRDQHFHFAIQAGEFLIGFGQRQAVAIRGDHG